MRAWRFHEFGDIANYTLEEIAEPELGEGEALISLRYASLNPADRLLILGRYPGAGDLPLTVGRDGSGTIERTNAGSRFKVGDEVIVLRGEIGVTRQGTLAGFVAAPEAVLAHLPRVGRWKRARRRRWFISPPGRRWWSRADSERISPFW